MMDNKDDFKDKLIKRGCLKSRQPFFNSNPFALPQKIDADPLCFHMSR